MGRRSRRRADPPPGAEAPAAPSRPRAVAPRRRARLEEAPLAPWHPFPLVELCILVGIVLLAVGFFGGRIGALVMGFVLVALASLELTIREHFAGYRSHSLVLALATTFLVGAPLWATGLLSRPVMIAVGAVIAVVAFFALRRAFARRAGGLTFRA
jgi:hypothetical protein